MSNGVEARHTWAAVAHERTLFISLQPGFGKTVDDDTLRCGSSHREVLLFGLIMSQPCPACGAMFHGRALLQWLWEPDNVGSAA